MAQVMQPTRKSNSGAYALIGQAAGSFGGPSGAAVGSQAGAAAGNVGVKDSSVIAPAKSDVQVPQAGPVAQPAPMDQAMQRRLEEYNRAKNMG